MTEFEVGEFRVRINAARYVDISYACDTFSLLTPTDLNDLREAINRALVLLDKEAE